MTASAEARGLILVNTGPGKGKTSAALGTAVRALGHGQKVAFVQFIKQSETGESRFLEAYAAEHPGSLFYRRLGLGCVRGAVTEADRQKAREALALSVQLSRADYDLLVLDEVCVAVSIGLAEEADVLALIAGKAPAMNLILTGRGCPESILALADTATEMRIIKHAYQSGVAARAGIDF